jgi:hypothetical protein
VEAELAALKGATTAPAIDTSSPAAVEAGDSESEPLAQPVEQQVEKEEQS